MIDAGAAEAKLAVKVIDLAIRQGWIDKLITALRKKHKVLVLGSTGAGKTNFLDSLTELMPKTIDHMNRTEFAKKRSIKISKSPFIFIDTPGQKQHSSRRIRAIRKAMADGIAGVVNVVSYGYHEYRTGKGRALKNDSSASEGFLKRHREVECEILKEWTVLLGSRETTNWLITVVTKADLWWDRRDEVIEYYQPGQYYDGLEGAQSLNPVVLEYCSVFHKFFGEGSLSGQFDETDRVRVRANMLPQLLAAIGDGEE